MNNKKISFLLIISFIIIGCIVYGFLTNWKFFTKSSDNNTKNKKINTKQTLLKNTNKIVDLKGKVNVGDQIIIGEGDNKEIKIVSKIVNNIPFINPSIINDWEPGTSITYISKKNLQPEPEQEQEQEQEQEPEPEPEPEQQ